METKKIFSPVYRQDYFEGYSIGLNPFLQINSKNKNEAFAAGFNSARMDYERMNGLISHGIPERIVTNKVLEDFLIAGLIGLSIDTEGYTAYQISLLDKWYQSGIEKYDLNQNLALLELLENNDIHINHGF